MKSHVQENKNASSDMISSQLCCSITMRGGGGLWRGTGNQLAMYVQIQGCRK